jgi:hypothetical protein
MKTTPPSQTNIFPPQTPNGIYRKKKVKPGNNYRASLIFLLPYSTQDAGRTDFNQSERIGATTGSTKLNRKFAASRLATPHTMTSITRLPFKVIASFRAILFSLRPV